MTESRAIIFNGPGARPGDAGRALAARDRFVVVADAIAAEHGMAAVLDGLISLYLDIALQCEGVERTSQALKLLRRELPRYAAAMRAAHRTVPAGHA